jgi:hypothetical protein
MRTAILVLILLGGSLAADPSDPVVPDLTGKTAELVVAAVHAAGFVDPDVGDAGHVAGPDLADLETCFNGTRVGTVCSQDPAAGQRAARATEIRVLLGDAATEPVLVMPDLNGMTLAQAIAAVKKAGFAHRLASSYADSCKPGLVCGQRFAPGMKVRRSSHLVVDVGR